MRSSWATCTKPRTCPKHSKVKLSPHPAQSNPTNRLRYRHSHQRRRTQPHRRTDQLAQTTVRCALRQALLPLRVRNRYRIRSRLYQRDPASEQVESESCIEEHHGIRVYLCSYRSIRLWLLITEQPTRLWIVRCQDEDGYAVGRWKWEDQLNHRGQVRCSQTIP